MDISEEYRRRFEDARRHAILATRFPFNLFGWITARRLRKHLESLTPELYRELYREVEAKRQDVMRRMWEKQKTDK
jgi:hypothetical protein